MVNEYFLTSSAVSRVIPLSIWLYHANSFQKIKSIVASEVQMTHPNQTVQELEFVYITTLIYMLKNY